MALLLRGAARPGGRFVGRPVSGPPSGGDG
jgi:hypothetical protein